MCKFDKNDDKVDDKDDDGDGVEVDEDVDDCGSCDGWWSAV